MKRWYKQYHPIEGLEDGPPNCILITMPERFFKEYPGGLEQFDAIMAVVDSGRLKWGQTCANIPTIEVPYVYLVYGGKVQLRLTLLDFEKGTTKEFNDGGLIREFKNKNWANLTGPVVRAPMDIPMRGFQGFRYCVFLF